MPVSKKDPSNSSRRNSAVPDPQDSAPDLELLGDQLTFQPKGYIEPFDQDGDGKNERNLVEHMARFRTSPLESVLPFNQHIPHAEVPNWQTNN